MANFLDRVRNVARNGLLGYDNNLGPMPNFSDCANEIERLQKEVEVLQGRLDLHNTSTSSAE